jgi:hypothetical protein
VFKLKSWNACGIVQKCHITKAISRISHNHECMVTLRAFSSVSLSFTLNCLHSEWSFNNLVIFLHSSLILLLSHCLFVSDHDVLSGSVWSLIIHVLRYDMIIATTDSCFEMKWAGDLCGALSHKYWVDSNDFLSLSVFEFICACNWEQTQSW